MKSKSDMIVCVLAGGLSREREVSFKTAEAVMAALERLGYKAELLDPAEWREGMQVDLGRFDVVFNALHGTYGEDGRIQGMLDCLGIPYTGSGFLGSALSMDKHLTKMILEREGIPTPRWQLLETDFEGTLPKELPFDPPFVIKPVSEGSSVEVYIVKEIEDLKKVRNLGKGQTYMIEEYVSGREVTVAVFDDRAIGACEIRVATEFYDYQAKYLSEDTRYIIPPELDETLLDRLNKMAERVHRILGLNFYSRTDFRVDGNQRPFVLEVNSLPGLTDHSLLPKICAHARIDYDRMVEMILLEALKR